MEDKAFLKSLKDDPDYVRRVSNQFHAASDSYASHRNESIGQRLDELTALYAALTDRYVDRSGTNG